jgi:hypothetical protein
MGMLGVLTMPEQHLTAPGGKNDSHQKLATQCKEQNAMRNNYRMFCLFQMLFEIGPRKSACGKVFPRTWHCSGRITGNPSPIR